MTPPGTLAPKGPLKPCLEESTWKIFIFPSVSAAMVGRTPSPVDIRSLLLSNLPVSASTMYRFPSYIGRYTTPPLTIGPPLHGYPSTKKLHLSFPVEASIAERVELTRHAYGSGRARRPPAPLVSTGVILPHEFQ